MQAFHQELQPSSSPLLFKVSALAETGVTGGISCRQPLGLKGCKTHYMTLTHNLAQGFSGPTSEFSLAPKMIPPPRVWG